MNVSTRGIAPGIYCLFCFTLILVSACSGGGGSDEITGLDFIGSYEMNPGDTTGELSVAVPAGSSAFTIIANGGTAGDIDIDTITSPDGRAFVNGGNDLIGKNFANNAGGSSVALTLPQADGYSLPTGIWKIVVSHTASVDNKKRTVNVYSSVRQSGGSVIDVNIILVDIADYSGRNDPVLSELIAKFKTALGYMSISAGNINIVSMKGAAVADLSIIDIDMDTDRNFQGDGLDELFRLSKNMNNRSVNFFLVNDFSSPGILGIAGGIPGIPVLQGTAHSGIAINTFGGLVSMKSAGLLVIQAETMVHELGHYLGLFHTTERNGRSFDPVTDTSECSAGTYDLDFSGSVSATECESADGTNLMFWQAANYPQHVFSDVQKQVLSFSPAVR